MFCTKCGCNLNPNDKFCKRCGALANPIQNNGGSMDGRVQNQAQGMQNGFYNMAQPAGYGNPQFVGAGGTVSPAGKAKGKIIIASITAVIVVAAGIIIYSMLAVPKPTDVVNKFVNAINKKDINAMVTCMDPKYELMYKGLNGLLSNITGGVNSSDLFDSIPGMYDFSSMYSSDIKDLSIKVANVESQDISGDNATLRVNLEARATDSSGQSQVQNGEAVFTLKKFSQGWRIVDFSGF